MSADTPISTSSTSSDVEKQEGRVPALVFHPSVFVLDELRARGWNISMLATHITGGYHTSGGFVDPTIYREWTAVRQALSRYLSAAARGGGVRLGDELTSQLAMVFCTSETFWSGVETAWLNAPPDRRAPTEPWVDA